MYRVVLQQMLTVFPEKNPFAYIRASFVFVRNLIDLIYYYQTKTKKIGV